MTRRLFAIFILSMLSMAAYGDITAQDITASMAQAVPDVSMSVPADTSPPSSNLNVKTQGTLQDEWDIVLFFKSTCPHCNRFDPVIADFARQSGFHIDAFSTDGGSLPDFQNPLPATPTVLDKFFPDHNIIVPAVFLVQKNTMQIIPISEGEISENDLAARLESALSQGAQP